MKLISILAGMAALAVSSGAAAHHLDNLDTPYPSRGACEAGASRPPASAPEEGPVGPAPLGLLHGVRDRERGDEPLGVVVLGC